MRLGVLAGEDSFYLGDLNRAAEERGDTLIRLDFAQLEGSLSASSARTHVVCGETDLTTLDVLIVRTMPMGSLEQVITRMNLLAIAEANGLKVVNPPKALECAIDKFLTSHRLQAAGIPTLPTIACETFEAAMAGWDRLDRDVVVKPLFGSEGRGIVRITDEDIAWRTFQTLTRLSAVLYLQPYIDHPGYDHRLLVLNDRVLGGLRRYNPLDFRTNISRSGRPEAFTPSAEQIELALAAAQATGTWFAGIDLLPDREGRESVLEVNAVPGWRAFAAAHQIDIARLFLEACATL